MGGISGSRKLSMNKQDLIKEVGQERAEELLSQWGREMRSRVKNPHKFNSKTASKAGKISGRVRRENRSRR